MKVYHYIDTRRNDGHPDGGPAVWIAAPSRDEADQFALDEGFSFLPGYNGGKLIHEGDKLVEQMLQEPRWGGLDVVVRQYQYRNHYEHEACGTAWTDVWTCCCDDECPKCHMDISPHDSDEIHKVEYPPPADEPDIEELVARMKENACDVEGEPGEVMVRRGDFDDVCDAVLRHHP